MLNQRRVTQAVSKVILPDKSHSSDEIPAQQLWAADIQNILILWFRAKAHKITAKWQDSPSTIFIQFLW